MPCRTFSFTPTAFIGGHRTSNQMLVWEPGGVSHAASTPPGAIFHFAHFRFSFSPPLFFYFVPVWGFFPSMLLLCCNSASRLNSRMSSSFSTLFDWQLGTKRKKQKTNYLMRLKMFPTFFRNPALAFGAGVIISRSVPWNEFIPPGCYYYYYYHSCALESY